MIIFKAVVICVVGFLAFIGIWHAIEALDRRSRR